MPSHLAFRSLAGELPVRRSQRSRSKEDDADFIGPLRVVVGAGLAYMLWLALSKSTPFPSDAHTPDPTKGS